MERVVRKEREEGRLRKLPFPRNGRKWASSWL